MNVRLERVVELAKDRFALQDYYGCIHFLEEIVESGEGVYADVHHLLGLASHLVGYPERAIECFDRALAVNPNYYEAHIHRGIVLNELGRSEEGQGAFASADEVQNEERDGIPGPQADKLANLHAELGAAYADAGAIEKTIEQYRTALRLGPTFHDLRYRLARTLLQVGRSLEAREELETLVAAKPDAVDVRATLGLAYYVSGDLETAQTVWGAVRDEYPDNARVRAYLAMLKRAHEKD
ncbi:MAG: tetratricopeptide repeat protein [Gemmatimonadetes bacterium]|nr:tetratricopeptide repeat protein [Gemmatimonadota bacterium]